ncbi:Phenylalanine--tRNA ligase alpha subunit [Candidatus Hodgkinia cicadicola]|nr:Phenylalanine--tRNA ligase alpha subunit [Candidatus Hodgkinia cicadicola]
MLARISGGAPANRDVNALNGIHPISNIEYKAFSTLNDAGFEFYESDEICDIEENFYTLNFSKLHPSLGIEDSFYVNVRGKASLLRTHTTSSLAKALSSTKPEFRRFTLGKVYRNDNSPKHLAFFTQVEGVICERAANLSKVVALVNYFICEILSAHAQIRIRRTSFPFTEPSVEIDLCCGKQFSSFKHDYNWLEVAGLGLVKQKVLTNLYSNFRNVYAFGLGLERLAMLKFNINNIRKFYTGLVL